MTREIVHKSQEQHDQSEVLFVGTSFKFISTALKKSLEEKNCNVYTSKKIKPKGILFDYVIFFGVSKKPKNYLKYLQQHAKGVVILSEQTKKKGRDTTFPMIELSAHETYPIETIIGSVEHTLFTQEPLILPDEILKKREKLTKKKKHKKKPKQKPKKPRTKRKKIGITFGAIIVLVASLFILPIVLYAGSLGVAANSLLSLTHEDITQETRLQKVDFAQKSLRVADAVSYLSSPFIEYINPEYSDAIVGALELAHAGVNTAKELVLIIGMLEEDIPGVLSGDASSFREHIPDTKAHLSRAELYLNEAIRARSKLEIVSDIPQVAPHWEKLEQLENIKNNAASLRTGLDAVPELLAFDTRKRYLLLFQNSFELRPTGGFIGSYAVVTIENGTIQDIVVEDVYEADGQLKGAVDPPTPIREHLGQPNWFLRDSNWNPDFSLSAKQAEWFLLKEKDYVFDGVIGLDIYAAQHVLDALGSVYVPDYEAKVTADDFFQKIQYETHDNFFPGSTAKKDLLSSLVRTILIDLQESEHVPYLNLARSLANSLNQKHISIYTHDRATQDVIESLGWGGRVLSSSETPDENTLLDYTMVIDANLGVNKVNYYIDREFFHTIIPSGSLLSREILINYTNNSSKSSQDILYNGIYKNYVRLLIPRGAVLETITIDDIALEPDAIDIEFASGKQSVGFLVEIPPESESQVKLAYSLSIKQDQQSMLYQLLLQKQSGTAVDTIIVRTEPEQPWLVRASTMPSNPMLETFTTDVLVTVDFVR